MLECFRSHRFYPHLALKYPSDDGRIHTIREDQKMARECYTGRLKVKPLVKRAQEGQSEIAMAELDPRTNAEDRVEPMGEVKPFVLGEETQVTMIGSNLINQ